ncbi:M48 family metallopeptidase [Burkholderiaceae bacterium DAT-1]|nr:M48 family metallopeptidase [Burkholderiaceae bacterium DAT-1]
MFRSRLMAFTLAGMLGAMGVHVHADEPVVPVTNAQFHITPANDAWRASLPRDADKATQAFMDRIPGVVRTRANDYFEGGYWLQLWNVLLGLVVSAALLSGKRSAKIRVWAQRHAPNRFLGHTFYGAAYLTVSWTLTLPLTIYQGFLREHAYGMATQAFGAWFAEQLIGLIITVVVLPLAFAVLYATIRKTGERWWMWGTGLAMAFMVLAMVISPIWIDPLFNTYKPVPDGPIRSAVLTMAKSNGVPADNVYVFDASRQTTRISANVSGIFGSAAVRLNDNLLHKTSLPEIRAVMGHELGHYVMNHVAKALLAMTLLSLVVFLLVSRIMNGLLAKYGAGWGIHGMDDIANLPLLSAVFSVIILLATPVTNTIIRTQEIEADRFALNLAREPIGQAEAFLKLTEYRKPDPTPIEEFIFFDHPSTRFRIHDAMRWREAMGTP